MIRIKKKPKEKKNSAETIKKPKKVSKPKEIGSDSERDLGKSLLENLNFTIVAKM